jgi:hypothetical protein
MDIRGSFLQLKELGCEADHSSPSNAQVKNAWSYISTFHGDVLNSAQGQLTVTLIYGTPFIQVFPYAFHLI